MIPTVTGSTLWLNLEHMLAKKTPFKVALLMNRSRSAFLACSYFAAEHYSWEPPPRPRGSISEANPDIDVTGLGRFGLVSSIYGPGNFLCWAFLFVSVLITWTVNKAHKARDTVTADLVALLTLPVVAAVDLTITMTKSGLDGGRGWALATVVRSLNCDDIRSVSALEAPLTVCEDCATLAALLYFIAARKGHRLRQATILLVWIWCLAVEAAMGWVVSGISYRETTFNRAFFFSVMPFAVLTFGWQVLVVATYLLEIISNMVSKRGRQRHQELHIELQSHGSTVDVAHGAETHRGRAAILSSPFSLLSTVLTGIGALWIKYMWDYAWPIQPGHQFRFVPKSDIPLSDTEQVVSAIGGLITLLYSLYDAFKASRSG